jgi:hypothetical protein
MESAIFQELLVPFCRKWYLNTRIWKLVVLIANKVLLLSLLNRQRTRNRYTHTHTHICSHFYSFLSIYLVYTDISSCNLIVVWWTSPFLNLKIMRILSPIILSMLLVWNYSPNHHFCGADSCLSTPAENYETHPPILIESLPALVSGVLKPNLSSSGPLFTGLEFPTNPACNLPPLTKVPL